MSISPDSIAGSLSFRVIRGFLGLAWYLTLILGVITLIYALMFAVNPRIDPGVDGGYRVGGGFTLGSAAELPIEVTYEWSHDLYNDRAIPQAVRDGEQMLVYGHDSLLLQLTDGYGAAYHTFMVVLCLGLALAVIWQLRWLCHDIAEGRPFCEDNAIRLRRLGFIIIFGSLVYSIATWVTASHYYGMIEVAHAGLTIDATLHLEDLGSGLLLLVLGQLFQLAARNEAERESLRADQELTV
ncbi:MAG: DUF2975 domain-containing protein [Gemmatimonadetes bacterium]|jgi:hypothetical protein|nr:DUF2975 domain-containing protein [Gemmatimonadota bacterium]